MKRILVLAFIICQSVVYAQDTFKVVTYNVLNYSQNSGVSRNKNFRLILNELKADILLVEEVVHSNGEQAFYDSVINFLNLGYAKGTFVDGPDSDNACYYKANQFDFLDNIVVKTPLRDINGFKLRHKKTKQIVTFFTVHLKAGQSSSDRLRKLEEVNELRKITDNYSSTENFIVTGDFNFYNGDEEGYVKLLDSTSGTGYFYDLVELPLQWQNNSDIAEYHSQSPRVRNFGGGANGGVDDRFDFFLISKNIKFNNDINYVDGTYNVIGNDGTKLNDSINSRPNNEVSNEIADALHAAADHLPVEIKLVFNFSNLLSRVTNFSGQQNGKSVDVLWTLNNEERVESYTIEKYTNNQWGILGNIVNAKSGKNQVESYTEVDANPDSINYYRLKITDSFGNVYTTDSIRVNYSPNVSIQTIAIPQGYFSLDEIIANHSISTYQVFDVSGRKMEHELNQLGMLNKGIYIIRLETNSGILIKKLIVY
jgi:endonuclease/exonuclease/phosphatase family metal-dependent hydrolase